MIASRPDPSPDTVRQLASQMRKRFPRALVQAAGRVPALPTGVAPLDALLPGGGLPLGRLTALSGAPSTGRTGLALATAARLTGAGERVAWVDPSRVFHPPSAHQAGVRLDRVLVVHPDPDGALGAATVLFEQEAVRLVILDLGELPPDPRAGPALTRLARAVSPSAAGLFLTGPLPPGAPLLQSLSVGVRLTRDQTHWQAAGPLARLSSLAVQAEVVRSRLGGEGRRAPLHLLRSA